MAPRNPHGLRFGILVVLMGLALGGGGLFASGAQAATYMGPKVRVGHGSARIVVRTDGSDKLSTIAVMLTAGALKGLPSALNKKSADGAWEYPLGMPAHGPKTGYSEVVIDWNPHGHPPPHIYTVPHFDFHFYTLAPAAVERISFSGPNDPAVKVSDAALIPPHYRVIPETAVNQMGVHAIDTTAPEFHGQPFTSTFIYGYYKGELIFLEPMVTRAFLLSKPNVTWPVRTPAQYSRPGYYPASYTVRYEPGRKAYMLELGVLERWGAD